MRWAALLVLSLTVTACSTQQARPSTEAVTTEQKVLRAATSKCGLPANRVQSLGGGRVVLKPHPNDDYRKIDCLLGEIGKVPNLKLGFVGNERIEENSK